jgi:hypothetical protein
LSQQCPPEYRQKTEATTGNALIRETDFAFKQSFAFCPYSPEAVFRYVNFLLQFRVDDALIVAQTCLKTRSLQRPDYRSHRSSWRKSKQQWPIDAAQLKSKLQQMENEARKTRRISKTLKLGQRLFPNAANQPRH